MKTCKSLNQHLGPIVPDIVTTRILTKTLIRLTKTSHPKDQVATTIITAKGRMTLSLSTLMVMRKKILSQQQSPHRNLHRNQHRNLHRNPLKSPLKNPPKNLHKLQPPQKRPPKNQLRSQSIQQIPSLSLPLPQPRNKPDLVASQATSSKVTKISTKRNFNWTGLTSKTSISRVNLTLNLTMKIPLTKDSIRCSIGCALRYMGMLI